ncbi:MAG: hypothetical protein ACRDZX_17975 [Acidimicrobiales bacterium]
MWTCARSGPRSPGVVAHLEGGSEGHLTAGEQYPPDEAQPTLPAPLRGDRQPEELKAKRRKERLER